MCMVDFEKAFDRVNWTNLMDILKDIGMDWRDRRLVTNLYMNQTVTVRINNEESDPGIVGRGVRQGCLLSPSLFKTYAEAMMKEALDGIKDGVKVGGRPVQAIRYADDQAMIADSNNGPQNIMNNLTITAGNYDMKINVKKTKAMKIGRDNDKVLNIKVNENQLEQVNKFKYLGSMLTSDGSRQCETRSRIAMVKEVFNKHKILKVKGVNRQLRKRLVKSLVWNVLLYGSETWTLKAADVKRLEACEMWIWRKMEKISWTGKVSNEEVLRKISEERSLIKTIKE